MSRAARGLTGKTDGTRTEQGEINDFLEKRRPFLNPNPTGHSHWSSLKHILTLYILFWRDSLQPNPKLYLTCFDICRYFSMRVKKIDIKLSVLINKSSSIYWES